MPYDFINDKPQNKTQLIKWNRAYVGYPVYHIRHVFDGVYNECIELSDVQELRISRGQTNACLYNRNGESYWSRYDVGDTFEFDSSHYKKTSVSNGRTYIAEYWYDREDANRRLAELQQILIPDFDD